MHNIHYFCETRLVVFNAVGLRRGIFLEDRKDCLFCKNGLIKTCINYSVFLSKLNQLNAHKVNGLMNTCIHNSVLLSKHNQLNAYMVVKSSSVKCCGLSTYFSQTQPSGLFFALFVKFVF